MYLKLYNYTYRDTDKQLFTNNDIFSNLSNNMRLFFNSTSNGYGFNYIHTVQVSNIETRTDNYTFSFKIPSNASIFNYLVDTTNRRIFKVENIITRDKTEDILISCSASIDAWLTLQYRGFFDYDVSKITQYNHIKPSRMHKNRCEVYDVNEQYVPRRLVYNADAEQPLPTQKRITKDEINYNADNATSIINTDTGVLINGASLVPFLVISIERKDGYIVHDSTYRIWNEYDTNGDIIGFDYNSRRITDTIDTTCKGSSIDQIFIPLYSADDVTLKYIGAYIAGGDIKGYQYNSNGSFSITEDTTTNSNDYIKSIQDVFIEWFEIGDASKYYQYEPVYNNDGDFIGVRKGEQLSVYGQNDLAWSIAQKYNLPMYEIVKTFEDTPTPALAYGFGRKFSEIFYGNLRYRALTRYADKYYNAFVNAFNTGRFNLIDIEPKIHTIPYEMFLFTDNNGIDVTCDIDDIVRGNGIITKRHALPNSNKSSIKIERKNYLQGLNAENTNTYKISKNSIPYVQSELYNFLTNERNAIIQGAGNKIVGGLLSSTAKGLVTGGAKGALIGLAQGAMSGAQTALDTAISIENQTLFLQDADGRYCNNGNDALYNLTYQPPNLMMYVIAQDDSILSEVAKIYHEYGYVNYDETTLIDIILYGRETFNYVETFDDVILPPNDLTMSTYDNTISLIRKCNDEMRGGVTLWCNQSLSNSRPNLFELLNMEKSNKFIKEYAQ